MIKISLPPKEVQDPIKVRLGGESPSFGPIRNKPR